MDWILLGNPENRRVQGFVDALAEEGHALRTVVAWRDVLDDPRVLDDLDDTPAFLRIESAGEHEGVQERLLHLGGYRGPRPHFGQVVGPTALHRGFVGAMGIMGEVLRGHPSWVPLATPDAILSVFDKRAFHERCAALGVPTPERLHVDTVDALYEALEHADHSVYVKLRYSSSASGLGVYRHRPRPRLMTTVRVTHEGRFNSLRIQRVTDPARIRDLLTWILEEEHGHVEVSAPKARLGGANFDCRVLMVAHEPAFVVVRHSRHPITNLHLGGWRGDPSALRSACPPEAWHRAMEDCRTVSRAYGGLHLGIDLLFEPGFRQHRLIEANAFGDLLPRLERDGRSVYRYEIAHALAWAQGARSS